MIVDDSDIFLRTVRHALECEGIGVVAVASTSAEALAWASELNPHVALVDINLGDEEGFDLAQQFTEAAAQTNVILISSYAEDEVADAVATTLSLGYLPKERLSGLAIRQLLGAGGDGYGGSAFRTLPPPIYP